MHNCYDFFFQELLMISENYIPIGSVTCGILVINNSHILICICSGLKYTGMTLLSYLLVRKILWICINKFVLFYYTFILFYINLICWRYCSDFITLHIKVNFIFCHWYHRCNFWPTLYLLFSDQKKVNLFEKHKDRQRERERERVLIFTGLLSRYLP